MSLINKLKIKFQNLIGFEKLNPLDNFDFDEESDGIKSINNIDLFKKAIEEHEELKEVIWIGLYHSLNTYKSDIEYLTVLNVDCLLIADLVEGNEEKVIIPDNVKKEILSGNVLATFHNHFNGAVIPSTKDLKNTLLPFVKFMVITSENNIGIIVNDMTDDSELFKQDWILFLAFINWSFNIDFAREIEELYDLKLNDEEFKREEEILFNKFLAFNLHNLIDEFNLRMEKYNVYFLHINIMEE
jgi:hypothetical protein